MAPVELHVVPRARYAAWLARRYLEATGGGQRGDVATRVVRSLPRRTSGIEYHRLREYEPGDRLRDVDWRHTLKLGELVVKERIDAPEGSVALLVNLVVANPEEADWLAYHIVMSALSAARQGMSTFILAYDERETVLALRALDGREAFQEALRLSTWLAYAAPIERLLAPPDILRLRRTVRLLEMSEGHEDGTGLAVVLGLELQELEQLAHRHPVAYLVRTLVQWGQQGSTITVVSRWNHDAEALAVMLPWLRSWGYQVVDLLSEKSQYGHDAHSSAQPRRYASLATSFTEHPKHLPIGAVLLFLYTAGTPPSAPTAAHWLDPFRTTGAAPFSSLVVT